MTTAPFILSSSQAAPHPPYRRTSDSSHPYHSPLPLRQTSPTGGRANPLLPPPRSSVSPHPPAASYSSSSFLPRRHTPQTHDSSTYHCVSPTQLYYHDPQRSKVDFLSEKLWELGYRETLSLTSCNLVEHLLQDTQRAVETCQLYATRTKQAELDRQGLSSTVAELQRQLQSLAGTENYHHLIAKAARSINDENAADTHYSQHDRLSGQVTLLRRALHREHQYTTTRRSSHSPSPTATSSKHRTVSRRRKEIQLRGVTGDYQRSKPTSAGGARGAKDEDVARRRWSAAVGGIDATYKTSLAKTKEPGANSGGLPVAAAASSGHFAAHLRSRSLSPRMYRPSIPANTHVNADVSRWGVQGVGSSEGDEWKGTRRQLITKLSGLLEREKIRCLELEAQCTSQVLAAEGDMHIAQEQHRDLSAAFDSAVLRLQAAVGDNATLLAQIEELQTAVTVSHEAGQRMQESVAAATESESKCQVENLSLLAQLHEAQQRADEALAEIEVYKTQRTEIYDAVGLKEAQRIRAQQHLEQLTSVLHGADSVHQNLIRELELRALQLHELEGQNVELREAGSAGRGVVEKIVDAVHSLQAKAIELETEKQELQKQLDENAAVADASQRKCSTLTAQLSSAAEEVLRVHQQKEKCQREAADLIEQKQQINSDLNRIKAKLQKSQRKEQSTEEVDSLKSQLKKTEMERDLAQHALADAREELSACAAKLSGLRRKHNAVKAHVAELAAAFERSSDAALVKEGETHRLKHEVETLKQGLQKVSTARAQETLSDSAKGNLEDRMHQLELLLAIQRQKYHELQVTHNSLRKSFDCATKKNHFSFITTSSPRSLTSPSSSRCSSSFFASSTHPHLPPLTCLSSSTNSSSSQYNNHGRRSTYPPPFLTKADGKAPEDLSAANGPVGPPDGGEGGE